MLSMLNEVLSGYRSFSSQLYDLRVHEIPKLMESMESQYIGGLDALKEAAQKNPVEM